MGRARWFLRVNLIQHDGCDLDAEVDHSRNFGGKLLNWFSINAGYHTAHHNRPGLHWTELPGSHVKDIAPTMKPELLQQSLLVYLAKTYVLRFSRPSGVTDTVALVPEAARREAA